MINVIVYT